MHFLVISVLCSVAVSVLLKLAGRYEVDIGQAIMVNYLVAGLATLFWFHHRTQILLVPKAAAAWPVLIALGVLLPAIFLVWARAVRHAGLVRADAAKRLSLLLPVIAAFTLFGEVFDWLTGLGVALGLVAIGCLVARYGGKPGESGHRAWPWLLVLFVGSGAIDILFKRVAVLKVAPFPSVLLATFTLAFILSVLAIAALYLRGRARARWRHVFAGIILGALNFGNIVTYIEAHRAFPRNPALVFSAVNIGVIAVAILVGFGLFHEHLNRWNRAGLALAIVAVVVLTLAA
jgi:drug/metabolite transporter (DMT)-like permease